MKTGRIAVMTVLACTLAWSCATTGARQDMETTPPPQQPEGGDADIVPAPEPEPAAEPEALPANVNMRFMVPDGWQSAPDPEHGSVVLSDPATGSRIILSGWPEAQGGTPREFIEQLWAQAADDAMSDTSLEVNMPMAMGQEDRAVHMFTVVREVQGPQGTARVTMIFLGLESNLPGFNILIIGIWPEALDGQMIQTLESVARSIIISSEPAAAPPAAPTTP